jgi:predicted Zn-dependent protease
MMRHVNRSPRRRLGGLLALCLTLGWVSAPAQARPKHRGGDDKVLLDDDLKLDLLGARPVKRSRKELEIERHEWMAQYYVMRGNDLEGAAKEYQAILRLDKKRVSAGLALAAIYQRAGKAKQALQALQALAKRNGKSPQVWLSLADVQGQQGDHAGQATSVQRAVALAPLDPAVISARFEVANQRFHEGDASAKDELVAAATAYLAGSRRLGPYTETAQRVLVELTDDPVALLVFDAKAAYAAAFESGRMTDINEKMADAKRGFEACLVKQPANQECHYQLGLVYSSVKASDAYNPVKALAELAKAPDSAPAAVEAARLLRLRDQNDEARRSLEHALRLRPGFGVALVELAILDKLEGKDDDAVDRLVDAASHDLEVSDRALAELAKVRPTHPLVVQASVFGAGQGDIFSTDRFKSAVAMVEEALGGVDKDAPELAAVEDIVAKLAGAAGVGSRLNLRVSILRSDSVNALAMPDGSVYVTRGMFDFLKKMWPDRPIDANNDALGHVLAHELAHVLRRHTVQGSIYREAVKDASQPLDPEVLTHVTRLQEIEADRDGIVIAALAGFHPRGGIELMEKLGKEREIPQHLDHPTFEERISYLQEYWTNDVRYAFVSFGLGVTAMEKAAKLEDSDLSAAVASYELAADHFKRFRATIVGQREVANNLGIVYAKLGVLSLGKSDTPLGRWRTRFSLERQAAAKYVGLLREEETESTRGAPGGGKARLPWQLREAIATFKDALANNEGYSKARLNLATAYLAGGRLDEATTTLATIVPAPGVSRGDIEIVRGVVLAEQGSLDKAQAAFEAAAKAPASAPAAAFNGARLLDVRGKKPEAKAAYLAYAKAYPNGPWAEAARTAAGKL